MNAKFVLRIPDDLHDRLKAIAKEKGVSCNTLITMVLNEHSAIDEKSRIEALEKRVDELETEVFKK